MANLAASAVTVNSSYFRGGYSGSKRKFVDATLVLTGQGDATDKITAAVLGLTYVDAVLSCQTDGDTVVDAKPSYDRTYVLLYAYNSASAAVVTDTVRIVVQGR